MITCNSSLADKPSLTIVAVLPSRDSLTIEFRSDLGMRRIKHMQHHGRIKRNEVIELCHLTSDQAFKLLLRLKEGGKLVKNGEKKGAYYTAP